MVLMYVDAISETRRRLAGELRAAAATRIGRGLRGLLLSSADQLEAHRNPSASGKVIYVVKGEEISDGAGVRWTVAAFGSQGSADRLVAELTTTTLVFGRSIGNSDLVGLELVRRRELESHLRRLDPQATVGRHGVRWYIEPTQFRGSL